MTTSDLRAQGYRMPAEWQPHEATWLAYPTHRKEWGEDLEPAREAFVALCRAISLGERIDILVMNEEDERRLAAALPGAEVRFHRIRFGDIWLRDIAPLFVTRAAELAAACFQFNGWGGKYRFADDPEVAGRIAAAAGTPRFDFPFVLEGGAVEVDGEGTLLTTRECLLNPNRNPGLDQAAIEDRLGRALGAERVLWLDRGLQNDHTDGHVDTLARFVAPGVVVCMEPRDPGDPNADAMRAIAADLAGFRDAAGRRLEVVRIPSPGAVLDPRGQLMPASYANFYVANRAVVVPIYGARRDDEAVSAIAALFPGRETIGIEARAVLAGGGAFHCITQQQPSTIP